MADQSSKNPFNKTSNQADTPRVRDKDNAQPRPTPPSFVRCPAPNIAPSGMLGIRTGLTPRPHQKPEPQKQMIKRANDNRNDQSLWIDGKIKNMQGYTFKAKLYDEPSPNGIDGGTIAKLDVRKDGDLVMCYDRGWHVDPKTAEHKEAVHRIRNGLDDTPSKDFRGFDRSPDKDRGFER